MKLLYEVFRWLIYGFIGITAVIILVGIGFVWLWNMHSVNSLREAKDLLGEHGNKEYILMIHECSKLIENGEELLFKHDDIPESLRPLSPQYVRVSMYSCEVNLYKAPAQGIGYFVIKSPDGSFELSWFNHFESWESHDIEVK